MRLLKYSQPDYTPCPKKTSRHF